MGMIGAIVELRCSIRIDGGWWYVVASDSANQMVKKVKGPVLDFAY